MPEPKVETFSFDADDTFSAPTNALGDDDDVQFAAWAASTNGKIPEEELLADDDPLISLLTNESGAAALPKEDDIAFTEEERDGHDVAAFDDEDEFGDDDGQDEDREDEDREDDDGDGDDIVDDGNLALSARQSAASSIDLLDAEDEEADGEDALSPLVDGEEADELDIGSVLPEKALDETEIGPPTELEAEVFEDPSEAELESAAELLTGTGLLGLSARSETEDDDSLLSTLSESKAATEGAKSKTIAQEDEDDDDIPLEPKEEEDTAKGLDSYNDLDDEDAEEFALLSESEGSFGTVWDLNEDNYITITQPGQTYAYELDEGEANDQEMATMRRGAQGGWGSGLQNDSANKHEPGSREWIARRSYDLIAQATPREMKLWTKRHSVPPADINALYPDMTAPMGELGKMVLTPSLPDAAPESVGVPGEGEGRKSERAVYGTDAMLGSTSGSGKANVNSGAKHAQSALERAVKFPCSFKFKVEGSGDGLIESLIGDVDRVLGKTIERETFVTEPAGRYTRVVFAVEVEEARHVTDLYDAFRHNALVKFSYG